MGCVALRMANSAKRGKCVTNVDDADKMRIVLEKRVGWKPGGKLSPVDPAKVHGREMVRSGGRASYWPINFVERSLWPK